MNPPDTGEPERVIRISDFFQQNHESLMTTALREINSLFPSCKTEKAPAGIFSNESSSNSAPLNHGLKMGKDADGLGHISQFVLDKMTLWNSVRVIVANSQGKAAYLLEEPESLTLGEVPPSASSPVNDGDQSSSKKRKRPSSNSDDNEDQEQKPTGAPSATVVLPTRMSMLDIKVLLRAHREGDVVPPCAKPVDDCAFSMMCRSHLHRGCPEGRRRGVAMVYANEWDSLESLKDKGRTCFFCELVDVNFSCISLQKTARSRGKESVALNSIYVSVEERGEFLRQDVITNPFVSGPFPRFDMFSFFPSVSVIDTNGKIKKNFTVTKNPGESFSDAYRRVEGVALEKTRWVYETVPGFFCTWQNFHSRGRLFMTQPIRPLRWVMETCRGAEWDPETLSKSSLLLYGGIEKLREQPGGEFDFLCDLLSVSFEKRLEMVRESGFPCPHFERSFVIQNCVILCPWITVRKFFPGNPEVYEKVFKYSSNEHLSVPLTLANQYPYHRAGDVEVCKRFSWYWTLMASANGLAHILLRFVNHGSSGYDTILSSLEQLSPMFDLMRRLSDELGCIPSDAQFEAHPEFAAKKWHPDVQYAPVVLEPRDDLMNLHNREIHFFAIERSLPTSFAFYLRRREIEAEKRRKSGVQDSEKEPSLTLSDLLWDYYSSAKTEEPDLSLVSARRASCFPLLAYMQSADAFDDEKLLEKILLLPDQEPNSSSHSSTLPSQGVRNEKRGRSGSPVSKVVQNRISPIEMFPVTFTSKSLAESNLPNHGSAVLELLVRISSGEGYCLSEAVKNAEHELVYQIFFSIFSCLRRGVLPDMLQCIPCLTETRLFQDVVGCMMCGTFDCLADLEVFSGRESIKHYLLLNSFSTTTATTTTTARPCILSTFKSCNSLVVMAFLLYLNSLATARPQIMVPLEEYFSDARAFLTGVIQLARETSSTVSWKKRESQTADRLRELAVSFMAPKPTVKAFCIDLSDEISDSLVAKRHRTYRELSLLSEAAHSFRMMVSEVLSECEGRPTSLVTKFAIIGTLFSQAISEDAGQHRDLVSSLFDVMRVFLLTSRIDRYLAGIFCDEAEKAGLVIFVRLVMEELVFMTEHAVFQVRHFAQDTHPVSLAQKGEYGSRGVFSYIRESLSCKERECRPLLVTVTDQNSEIHNARRHMRGAKLADLVTKDQRMRTTNLRLQGKPSKKKLLRGVKDLEPSFFRMPGTVLVFQHKKFSFRKSTNSRKQASKINFMILKKYTEIAGIFSKMNRGIGSFVGGMVEETPSTISIEDPLDPATKLSVRSLVNCTECGQLVEYGLHLFGPWGQRYWCRMCPDPIGSKHISSYCSICDSRIVHDAPVGGGGTARSKAKGGVGEDLSSGVSVSLDQHTTHSSATLEAVSKTDKIDDYGVKRRRGGDQFAPQKTWCNKNGETYYSMDEYSEAWYRIEICQACQFSNKLDRVRDHPHPLYLHELREALKNPTSLVRRK